LGGIIVAATNFLGDDVFVTHVDYPRLLAGAHRRRVTPLGAPSLIRHVAFWNPAPSGPPEIRDTDEGAGKPENAVSSEQEPKSIADRAAKADRAIAELYRSLLAKAADPDTSRQISQIETNSVIDNEDRRLVILFCLAMAASDGTTEACPSSISPDSYRTIKISFLWHGLPTTLSFELHTEFLSMTTVIDVSKKREDLTDDQSTYGGVFVDVERQLRAFARIGVAPLNADPEQHEEACQELHEFLYYDVWNRFAADVLKPLAKHNDSLKEKFIDFRGIVLGACGQQDSLKEKFIGLPGIITGARGRPRVKISEPFSREPDERGTGIERNPICDMKEFDKLWTFVTCMHQKDTEFTVSRFLGGRAFYATALGNQPRAMLEGTGRPLCYLMYEDTLNDWQLGRLIYRVHRAGTARISAIMHFAALRTANQHLTDMEGELEKVNAGVSDDAENFREWLQDGYDFVQLKLRKISVLHLDGTLEARIERSRYYVNQFAVAAEALRIERVTGFQRYDEFVSQRLGPVFDYIDNLGKKYTRVRNEMAILVGRIQTYNSLRNEEISLRNEEISLRNEERSLRNEEMIAEAQQIADIALTCVLAPYYVGYLFAHAFSGIFEEQRVWITAFTFGVIRLGLLTIARKPVQRIFGESFPRRFYSFAIVLLLAMIAAPFVASGGRTLDTSVRELKDYLWEQAAPAPRPEKAPARPH
jgi:hypothetical protein